MNGIQFVGLQHFECLGYWVAHFQEQFWDPQTGRPRQFCLDRKSLESRIVNLERGGFDCITEKMALSLLRKAERNTSVLAVRK